MKGENLRPGRGRTVAECVVLLIAFGVTLALASREIHVTSGDLAQHYQLAQRIADSWRWPMGDPYFGDMRFYPPLSHALAAALGTVIGSTFLAMNLIAAASVFGCYFLLARGLSVGSDRASVAALALAVVGLFFVRRQHAAEGFEVDFNYFYAQLVAEFFFLLFAFWLCRTRLSWPWRLAATAVATILACCTYLMAAVEIALAYICLEGFFLLRRIIAARTVRLPWLAPVTAGGLGLPLLIAVNPYFRVMVGIASNDGQLELHAFQHLVPGLAVVLLVLTAAVGVLAPTDNLRWRGGTLFLATAGCATAVAALTQVLIQTVSNSGSDYAVHKYGFSVITLLVFAIGAVVAVPIEKARRWPSSPVFAVLAPAALAAMAAIFMHAQPAERLDKFVKYQKAVRAFIAENKAPADAIGHTSSGNVAFRYPLNHVITFGDLGMAFQASLKSIDASIDPSVPPPETYSFVDDRAGYVAPKCVLGRVRTGAVLLSLPCQRATPPSLALDKKISVADSSERPPYFIYGWSGTEATGVWSGASRALLGLHLNSVPDPVLVTVHAEGYLPTPGYVQHVPVFVHGVQLDTWTFDARSPNGARTVEVPAALAPGGDVMLEFRFPDATSPAKYHSTDGRLLAMYVTSFSAAARYPDIGLGQTVSLAEVASIPPYLRSGWSMKEPTAVWSDGDHATLALHLDQVKTGEPLTLSVKGMAYLPQPNSVQTVIVRSGDKSLATWRYDKAAPSGVRTVKVPAALFHNGNLDLDLDFPNAVSPATLGSVDKRRLGLYLSSFSVSTRYPDIGLDQTVSLAKTAHTPPYFRSGWGNKEPTAVWSDGDRATLALHVDKAKASEPLTVSIEGLAYLPHPDSAQTVIVRSGSRRLAAWRYDKAAPSGVRTVKIPAGLARNGDLDLELDFPDAVSPAAEKMSGDPRRLGLYVSAITVN